MALSSSAMVCAPLKRSFSIYSNDTEEYTTPRKRTRQDISSPCPSDITPSSCRGVLTFFNNASCWLFGKLPKLQCADHLMMLARSISALYWGNAEPRLTSLPSRSSRLCHTVYDLLYSPWRFTKPSPRKVFSFMRPAFVTSYQAQCQEALQSKGADHWNWVIFRLAGGIRLRGDRHRGSSIFFFDPVRTHGKDHISRICLKPRFLVRASASKGWDTSPLASYTI